MTDTKQPSIRITCECGKKYRCRRNHFGKDMRCRHCGETIAVPDPESDHRQGSTESTPTSCPDCGSTLLRGIHLCHECGYGFDNPGQLQVDTPGTSSRKLKSASEAGSDSNTQGGSIQAMMGAGLLLAAVALSVYYCSTGLNGPQFLGLYTCLFAIYWISAELLRSLLVDASGSDSRLDILWHWRGSNSPGTSA